MRYTIGIDFGTLSCRAVALDAQSGAIAGVGEKGYALYDTALPDGTPLPPRAALAEPREYLEAMSAAVRLAVQSAGIAPETVCALAVDATSLSALCCDENGVPLCEKPDWRSEPLAYIRLWKSYTATGEAALIGQKARAAGEAFLTACGGEPSSEGMYPKMLETLRLRPALYHEASVFVDLNEWLTWRLTGRLTRSAGSMGLKNYCYTGERMTNAAFWESVYPGFGGAAEKLRGEILPWGARAGFLTAEMAARLGLPPGIAVGAGGLDGHTSMMALGVRRAGEAMMTVGTSGVLGVLGNRGCAVPGVCGAAKNAMIPGLYGYDFCQSGVGDMFAWFVGNCLPARYAQQAERESISPHTLLSRLGFALPVRADAPVAVDWWNGSRCVTVDQTLRGGISGLRLTTKPEEIYRALVEAAAFGMRFLIEYGEKYGLTVNRIAVCGGIAGKNPLLMQCYADVLGRSLEVSLLPNSAAAGSAIGAAAAAGLYPSLDAAIERLQGRERIEYAPDAARHKAYETLYARYLRLRKALLTQ